MLELGGKRLMILGAGAFQASGISKAAALGCHVITVDNVPGNVGHQYGHFCVTRSTVDKESVLKAARELRIDGICTFSSDVAVPTVAYVCERLALPGPSGTIAEIIARKHRFRAFLREAGLTCPDFASGEQLDGLPESVHRMKLPVVFKPVDASGSRGITRLDRLEPGSLERAFLKAQSYSPSKTVCVEEFVPGTEVGGDAVLLDGRVAFIAITHKRLRGFVVTGHSLPTNITARDQQRVVEHIEAICAALGYRYGPVNFDVIISEDAVTMLEMSARNGGNGIAGVIERATGVDVEQATIRMALGVVPDLPARVETRRCAGSYVFGHPTGGRLDRICKVADLRRRVPEVFHAFFAKQPGDRIEPFEHNGNLIGFALFDCRNPEDYDRVTERISANLDIAVHPH